MAFQLKPNKKETENKTGFNRFSKRYYAYTFLLTRCRGKNIDECNAILEELGIEQKYWLGSYDKRPRIK